MDSTNEYKCNPTFRHELFPGHPRMVESNSILPFLSESRSMQSVLRAKAKQIDIERMRCQIFEGVTIFTVVLRYNGGAFTKAQKTTNNSFLSPCSDRTLHSHYLSVRTLHSHSTTHIIISPRISCHTCLGCLSNLSCKCDCHTYLHPNISYTCLTHPAYHVLRASCGFLTTHIPFLVCSHSFLMVPANSHKFNPNGTSLGSSLARENRATVVLRHVGHAHTRAKPENIRLTSASLQQCPDIRSIQSHHAIASFSRYECSMAWPLQRIYPCASSADFAHIS